MNWVSDRVGGRREDKDQAAPTGPADPKPKQKQKNEKTFLLGVGAQKAGTTWLHKYLARSPQCAPGYRKEYHVFDSRDLPSEEWMRDRILGMAHDELEKARRGEPADPVQLHRASMYVDPEYYYDYFAGLLRSRPKIRLTGDVTPDYALLPVERFADIKASFRKRRIRTVGVFLMRDPVDRIWSQIRMQQGRRPERFPESAEMMVPKLFDDPLYASRSQYEHTIRNLDAVFDPDQLWFGFYEQLFDEETVRDICRFLGVDYHEPDFGKMANVSAAKTVEALPDDVVRTVATHLRETYQVVAERFPDTDLTKIWPSSRFVL